jgi:hypothetical protein
VSAAMSTVLSAVSDWLTGCAHRRTSFPITCRTKRSPTEPARNETYVVCLECGKRFPYDWEAMCMVRKPDESVGGGKRELGVINSH